MNHKEVIDTISKDRNAAIVHISKDLKSDAQNKSLDNMIKIVRTMLRKNDVLIAASNIKT